MRSRANSVVKRTLTGSACLAVLSLVALGCFHARSSASTNPAPAPAPETPPPLEMMKISMVPTVRESLVLKSVTHDAPSEGFVLGGPGPRPLHVTASGTGNLAGEAWLEGPGGAIAKTPMTWDENGKGYVAEIPMSSKQIQEGSYDLKAILRADGKETEVMTAVDPVLVKAARPVLATALAETAERFRAFFDTDSDALRGADRVALQEIVEKLHDATTAIRSIVVEGHCDLRGSEVHNRELGERRAASLAKVIDELLAGVAVRAESLGEIDPNPPDNTPEAWQKNRWARIRIETK